MKLAHKPKLDFFSTKKKVVVIIAFVIFLFFAVGIGALGPQVMETKTLIYENLPSNQNLQIPGEIIDMSRLHHSLFIYIEFFNSNDYKFDVEGIFDLTLSVRSGNDPWKTITKVDEHKRMVSCSPNSFCNKIYFIHETCVEYDQYQFVLNVDISNTEQLFSRADVSFEFYKKSFILFRMVFGFIFLIFSIGSLCLWAYNTFEISWRKLRHEQKWITVLSFALIFFNNPFYPTIVLVKGWFPDFLESLFRAVFLVFLLSFWLVAFDSFRFKKEHRSFLKLILPKLILFGAILILFCVTYLWEQLHLRTDPQYQEAEDMPGFYALRIIIFILLGIYLLWLIYTTYRAFREVKDFPENKSSFYFMFAFSFITFIFTAIFLSAGYIHQTENTSIVFLSTFGIFNLYIWFMVVVFSPTRVEGLQKLDEEDDIQDIAKSNDDLSPKISGDDLVDNSIVKSSDENKNEVELENVTLNQNSDSDEKLN
ncbi:transmembrane protein [Anaeramoeba ignava]|uniref:Transmembrane protein n=1 Tax=Anaeramoeba ignava TaxID=1746090 RepID=A0A9Q0R4R0_ANAIG|nr:transmembrane protein [Anaeramoeba ignava]